MAKKMTEEEKKERESVVQSLSVRTEEGVYDVLDFAANGIVNNRLTYKQVDALNTTAKTALATRKLRKDYFKIIVDLYRKENSTPEEIMIKVEDKLPDFFSGSKHGVGQIEENA